MKPEPNISTGAKPIACHGSWFRMLRASYLCGAPSTLGGRNMKKLIPLILTVLICGCQSPTPRNSATNEALQNQAYPTPDYDKPVDIWLVPLVGFPDEYIRDLATRISKDSGLHVRTSLNAGISQSLFFPDSEQMIGDKALLELSRIIPSLSNSKPNTAYLFLTTHDLNSADRRFRFLFAQNNPKSKMAIISIARLRFNQDGPTEAPSITKTRLFKMAKRQVGELYYGYARNTDPNSVMYSPLMGLDEVDMISQEY